MAGFLSRSARVQRIYGVYNLQEIGACALVLVALVSLFVAVRPQPVVHSQPDTAPALFADFRDLLAPVAALSRTGHTTQRADARTVLEVLGASPEAARAAAAAITATGLADARNLPEATELTAHFEGSPHYPGALISVSLRANAQSAILVTRRLDGSFLPSVLSARKANGFRRIAGTIETDLDTAVLSAGGRQRHASALAALFPDDQALQAGGRRGERFDLVYEVVEDERGNVLAQGDLVFAAFDGTESKGSWYLFAPSDTQRREFYTRDGEASLPLLSRYPVGFVPITSSFGPRYHPLSGERQLHGGIDYFAPYGSPIYAAGDGTIERADWGLGYGRHVRITHKRGLTTLYAHMSAYAEGIKEGTEIRKGDLIGYVGASGAATGPHLHYEIRKDGTQINPALLKLPSGRRLARDPAELAAFHDQIVRIDAIRGAVAHSDQADRVLPITGAS